MAYTVVVKQRNSQKIKLEADNMTRIKRKCFFVRKRLKQALMLVGILIITLAFSGCEKLVETDVSAETKSTIQTVSETTVPVNQEETQFVTEFEITDWTIEEFISNITIYGQQINLPFNVENLPDDFYLSEKGVYVEVTDTTGFSMYYKDKEIAYVYCNGKCEDNSNALITSICFGMFNPVPKIKIMGITEKSNYDFIIKKLGLPNNLNNDNELRYIFANNKEILIHFQNNDEKEINFLSIEYVEE